MGSSSLRLKWLDIAKGIGIYCVILGHLVTYGSPISRWIFSFHMPLFFYLSGVNFRYSENYISALKKIAQNLILPYFIIIIVSVLISLLHYPWMHISLLTTLKEIFYSVQPESLHVGQIWFLFALAVVQFFFIIIKKINNKKVEYFLLILFPLIALLFEYLKQIYHIHRPPFKLDTASMALMFFYLGVITMENNYIERFIFKNKFRIALLFIALILNIIFGVILNSTINMCNNNYQNPFFFFIASITGILTILLITSLIKENKIVEFYGRYSMPIFSFHSFFLFLYANIISIIFSIQYTIMYNIPTYLCFVGFLFVSIFSAPLPILYSKSIGSIINYFKSI